jgi:hypothetical protein
MWTRKISTTLREEVSREKIPANLGKEVCRETTYLQLWTKRYAERQNICYFRQRSMQGDKISTTLGEEACRETKCLLLWAKKYAERQNIYNFGRGSMQRAKRSTTLGEIVGGEAK